MEIKTLKKEIAKYERQLEKVDEELITLEKAQVDLAFDHEKLSGVMAELAAAHLRKNEIEESWLLATTQLEELGE